MKKGKKRILAALLATLMTVGIFTGCAESGSASSESETVSTQEETASTEAADRAQTASAADEESEAVVYDTTITMAYTTAWDSLMPYYSASGSMYTSELNSYIYDRLAYMSEGGNVIKPRAAESWESADDGYAIIFYLNPDCKWHDGETVTAQDWVWTLETVSDADAVSTGISSSATVELIGTDNYGIRIEGETFGAEALDDYTLKLTLKNLWTPEDFLIKYNRSITVLPEHLLGDIPAAELLENDFWSAPIGSGPCIFVSEIIGSEIYLKANRDYQFPVNGFGTLKCVVMSSSNTVQAEISGDIDLQSLGSQISVDDAEVYTAAGYEVITAPSATFFLEMILNNDSLDDVNLRLAIYYALDRETGAEISAKGLGTVVDSYVLPTSDYYNTDLVREYDVETAKEYLAKSNYDGRTLKFAVASSRAELAAWYQQNLADAGISVEVITVDVSTMFSGLTEGIYDMGISGHSGSAYPLWFASNALASNYGSTYYSITDPGYEEIYDRIMAETDETTRRELINELQQYMFDNVPWIPLYFSTTMHRVSPTVTGVDYEAGMLCNDNLWDWVKAE